MFHFGKLNDEDKIIEIVQSETRITDGEHVFLSAENNFDGSSYIGRSWVRPKVQWRSISRRQAIQQLIISDLDEKVEEAINAVEDTKERKLLKAWFDNADPWERSNEAVASIGQSLELSEEDIDNMFKEASKL